MKKLSALALVVLVAACSKNSEPPSGGTPGASARNAPQESGPGMRRPTANGMGAMNGGDTAPPAGPAGEARVMFGNSCAMCHGQTGKGDGPMSAQLNPKPRDYSDKAWQASVTDAQIAEIITKGGAAVGKSPMMGGHPELAQKPEVLAELVKLIRSFGN